MKTMNKKHWICLSIGLAAVLLTFGILFYARTLRPYWDAENTMPQELLTVTQASDGVLTISWGKAEGADQYLVEFIGPDGRTLWSETCADPFCVAPDMALDGEVTLRVSSMKKYSTLLKDDFRMGDEPLQVRFPTSYPSFAGLTSTLDADADTLTLTWDAVPGEICTISDANGRTLLSGSEGSAVIRFGTDVPMPGKGDRRTFILTADLTADGIDFISAIRAEVSVDGEDLLGTDLCLTLAETGNNCYALAWNETRGARYEIQTLSESGDWQTISSFADAEPLTYTVGPLAPYTDYTVRVVALGGHTLPDSAFAAVSNEISFSTGATVMYAAIWPLKDLTIYADSARSRTVGTAYASRSYCVMGEENGMFLVYFDDGKGYIDSDYCLINLPDYLGDLCSYDIKNSYDAIYMVHDYGIPEITGTVITGYEEVGADYVSRTVERTVLSGYADGGAPVFERETATVSVPTTFLAPLLYPTAQKLAAAAETAREMGYRLKIYDAYRPWSATRFLYDQTERLLREEIPERVYAEMEGEAWDLFVANMAERLNNRPEVPDGGDGESADCKEEEIEVSTTLGQPSYYLTMTNNSFSLGAFLARSGSYHNLGVAVDLTLESADTGEELRMQTAMHDLSWNSILSYNNDNARALAGIMTGSGLAPLSSEWWHFQDDELRTRVTDLASRANGVTRAGWIADNTGWRYRTEKGVCPADGTYTVNGRSYTFDRFGYADYAAWETQSVPADGSEL